VCRHNRSGLSYAWLVCGSLNSLLSNSSISYSIRPFSPLPLQSLHARARLLVSFMRSFTKKKKPTVRVCPRRRFARLLIGRLL
jgi:hypothetical protein